LRLVDCVRGHDQPDVAERLRKFAERRAVSGMSFPVAPARATLQL
jgi:hypothetical protein